MDTFLQRNEKNEDKKNYRSNYHGGSINHYGAFYWKGVYE
ncbi:hypothetical protein AB996_0230 [Lactococcus cremoris]|uniref:Uncharacterized protein n=1 Tax=Lactococcus lactis subsp. cremoris TaxID=1359 RepID=A0A166KFV9_LACLC|nr:hypothetical protein AB996_0230 [Lactococcus cremoris]